LPIPSNLEGLLAQLAQRREKRPGLLALDVSKQPLGVTWLSHPLNNPGGVV
jgi:hypothetical protein